MSGVVFMTVCMVAIVSSLALISFLAKRRKTALIILVGILCIPTSVCLGIITSNQFVNNYSNEDVFMTNISSWYYDEFCSVSCTSKNNKYLYVKVPCYKINVVRANQNYTSVKLGNKDLFVFGGMQYYNSATILAPTQEDVQLWQQWIQLYVAKYKNKQVFQPERFVPYFRD